MKNPWLKRNQIKEIEEGVIIRIFVTEERYYNIEYSPDSSMEEGKKTLTVDLIEDSSELISEMFTKIILPRVLGFGEHFNMHQSYGSNFTYNPSQSVYLNDFTYNPSQSVYLNDFTYNPLHLNDFSYNITFEGTSFNVMNTNGVGKYFK